MVEAFCGGRVKLAAPSVRVADGVWFQYML